MTVPQIRFYRRCREVFAEKYGLTLPIDTIRRNSVSRNGKTLFTKISRIKCKVWDTEFRDPEALKERRRLKRAHLI